VLKTKQQAVEHATKTLELEGFSFSLEEKKLLKKVANGEMTTKELREHVLNKKIIKEAIA
jgi:hypothetical protein